MPLTRHELELIQCDCAADDIEIPDAARAWSEEEASPSSRRRHRVAEPARPGGDGAPRVLRGAQAGDRESLGVRAPRGAGQIARHGGRAGGRGGVGKSAPPTMATPPTPTPTPLARTPPRARLRAPRAGRRGASPSCARWARPRWRRRWRSPEARAAAAAARALRAPPTAARRPRILCLHGNGTCGDILRRQTAALWAQLDADCTFLDGDLPTVASDPAISDYFPGLPQLRYATPSKMPAAGDAIEAGGTYVGLQAALERIAAARHRGGRAVRRRRRLLAGRQPRRRAGGEARGREEAPLRFVVAFCGSQFGWAAQLPELFAAPLVTPALLVRGEKDTLCPAPLCEALAALFRAGAVACRRAQPPATGHCPSAPQENVALCRQVARFAEAAVAIGS